MRENVKKTSTVIPDTLPDDSQYKYRYKPDRQNKKSKNRNFNQGKPATIFQIVATTEFSTNRNNKYDFRTPPSYQHENNFDMINNDKKKSSTSQTESFFSSDGCGEKNMFKLQFYFNIVALFICLCFTF